jgi:hypothetical protein
MEGGAPCDRCMGSAAARVLFISGGLCGQVQGVGTVAWDELCQV